MKITMTIRPIYDNEIQFFDACKGAADKLMELAEKAINDGDVDQFIGTVHEVVAANDDAENIGTIQVRE